MSELFRPTEESGRSFTEALSGGAAVFRAEDPYELIYVNDHMAELFECEDREDLCSFTEGSFRGIVNETDFGTVFREIKLQLNESSAGSGYVFFHIRTKKGTIKRIVSHWTLVHDKTEGDIFYAYLFLHHADLIGSEFDSITGLYGKTRLIKHIKHAVRESGKDGNIRYAIAYLNLVHFKLLNIEKGASEGDACLHELAYILQRVFSNAFIARISDDHFAIFTDYDTVFSKSEEAEALFRKSFASSSDVRLKIGIQALDLGRDPDIETALSLAKLVCDYIKSDGSTDVAEYSDELALRIKTRKHVIKKLDEALEKEWIAVYYQPVVRSVNGWLCGMESLVRWIDPEMGILYPDQFIPILEEEALIHRLDAYVVDKVCSFLHDRVIRKEPVVPVSVNFSRLDFINCDMLEIVEAAVKKHEIPRDYIHIEITESMIVSDEELMRNIIESFRQAGYEVWMDDFGSGYSSLNLLKDYNFDMLKLDMRFLTPFTEKSKSIVLSTVTMAKDIGIMTLAEGVETEEQLDFLKEIGCTRIQGFYYGKPAPPELVFEHIKEKQITVETRKWRHFYDVAGQNIRATDSPLEIVEDDGERFFCLYMNQKYREQIGCVGMSLEDITRNFYHYNSPLTPKFREAAKKLESSGREESFYYIVNGSYFRLTAQVIAENSGHFLIRDSLTDISRDPSVNEADMLDQKLRELNLLVEDVLLLDLSENSITTLLGANNLIRTDSPESPDIWTEIADSLYKRMHPKDHSRFRLFIDFSTLKDRLAGSEKGYVGDLFRIKYEDGNYRWTENYILPVLRAEGREYLYCTRTFSKEGTAIYEEAFKSPDSAAGLNGPAERILAYGNVFDSILQSSLFKIFWKDKDRRFRGVSRAFLEYYDIKDENDILGKTDEDMGWHIDIAGFMEAENAILEKGESFLNVFGKCIVRGEVREICYSKIPLYKRGEVCGLVGCFVDWEEERSRILNITAPFRKDSVTGLLNTHSFVDNMIDYAEQYNQNGMDFALMLFNNSHHDRIRQTYGEEFAKSVLCTVADSLMGLLGTHSVIARPKDSVFAVLMHLNSSDELKDIEHKAIDRLEGITEVNGNRITMRIRSYAKLRSQTDTADEALYEEALKSVL
ncbi:MAG: EAL domain-containing protein [Lachnospiraceae bacterium]|nr:EAL domain-containing protein [Lachnospiraceae bacterium]